MDMVAPQAIMIGKTKATLEDIDALLTRRRHGPASRERAPHAVQGAVRR